MEYGYKYLKINNINNKNGICFFAHCEDIFECEETLFRNFLHNDFYKNFSNIKEFLPENIKNEYYSCSSLTQFSNNFCIEMILYLIDLAHNKDETFIKILDAMN